MDRIWMRMYLNPHFLEILAAAAVNTHSAEEAGSSRLQLASAQDATNEAHHVHSHHG